MTRNSTRVANQRVDANSRWPLKGWRNEAIEQFTSKKSLLKQLFSQINKSHEAKIPSWKEQMASSAHLIDYESRDVLTLRKSQVCFVSFSLIRTKLKPPYNRL